MQISIASVHGRFQPPHLDHLEYMLKALEIAKHVVIGITQPDVAKLSNCPEDPHRAELKANPLSYEERCDAITQMLLAEGIHSEEFSFARFPIERPSELTSYLSTDIVCLTTIRDQWNIVKVERLQSLGYNVRVLWDRRGQAGIQGTEIRARICENDNEWQDFVHPAVARYLIASGIVERIRKLASR